MKIKPYHQMSYNFLPESRLGRVLGKNLSWNVNQSGQKVQLVDRGGFVYDLDKQGRIIRMTDGKGKTFKVGC